MAVLALDRTGLSAHPRVEEGRRVIRDRAVASGGWNYGNREVFGRALRAQPGPTGLALLALAGQGPAPEVVSRGLSYLRATLPAVRAPASLAWGVIGMGAWGERPAASDHWLAESYAAVSGRPDAAPRLACLLLAASGATRFPIGPPPAGAAGMTALHGAGETR
jgi:hypothetical protein